MSERFIVADVMDGLRGLEDQSVQCVVTSPPYWGLRDYGVDGQLGLETTPEEYVERMTTVFREARRVLRDDGTLWLNLGDCYTPVNRGENARPRAETLTGIQSKHPHADIRTRRESIRGVAAMGLKSKDLVGIPWRVAFALQADGWYLRSDIIWAKPNPMPESVQDRPTKAHEYVFLLSKSERYYYDREAIAEPASNAGRIVKYDGTQKNTGHENRTYPGAKPRHITVKDLRNRRSVWTIPTQPYRGSHYAVMPEALASLCVQAGCPVGGVVLDPFFGSGTTAVVCRRTGRDFIGIDVDGRNVTLAEERLAAVSLNLWSDEG